MRRRRVFPLRPPSGAPLLVAPARAECIDLNAAPPDELARITHIDGERAALADVRGSRGMEILIGAIFAVFGIIISALQYEANRTKLIYELFQHRQTVYKQVEELRHAILSSLSQKTYGQLEAMIDEFDNIIRIIGQIFGGTVKDNAQQYAANLRLLADVRRTHQQIEDKLRKYEGQTEDEKSADSNYVSLMHELTEASLNYRLPLLEASHIYSRLMDEMAEKMRIPELPSIFQGLARVRRFFSTKRCR